MNKETLWLCLCCDQRVHMQIYTSISSSIKVDFSLVMG